MIRTEPRWLRQYQATEILRELRNQEVMYLPNSGNAGDSLISTATMQLFRRLNISFIPIDNSAVVDGKTVILGGGGNFIPQYATIRTALERFAGRAHRIILLSHTIRGNEELISSMPPHVLFMCREIPSYEHVININPKCEIVLTHDMAFHLDVDELLFDDPDHLEFQKIFQEKLAKEGRKPETLSLSNESQFFRKDNESTGRHPTNDLDISWVFEFGVWPRNSERSSWCFMEAIRLSQSVVTDRLHVGIGASILNKPCKLYDNSYGKNRDIFRHSLRGWSSVQFME